MNEKLNHRNAWLLLLTMVALAGCKAANPIGAAETSEQRAYAAYGTYVIFAEKAADLAEQPNIPRSVKLRLIEAEERASPIMNTMLDMLAEYERTKSATAYTNLTVWVDRALPLIAALVRNVKGAES